MIVRLRGVHSCNKMIKRKTHSEGNIQLTIAINFTSSKDSDETRTMHAKSNNVEIMTGSETDEVIEELLKSFLQKYQEGLEESTRGSANLFLIVLMHCIIILIKYA